MSCRVLSILLTAWVLALTATPVLAQNFVSQLAGEVVGEDGSALANVEIEALDLANGAIHRVVTDSNGAFRLLGLRPGRYRIRAMFEGFSVQEVEAEVQFGASQSITFRLAPATIAESVTVTSDVTRGPEFVPPSWNSWLENRDPASEPVERLEVGHDYFFYLDLAPFAYRRPGVASAGAGSGLLMELQRALTAGRTIVVAQLRPLLVGRVLKFAGPSLQAETWEAGEWVPAPSDGRIAMKIRLANLKDDDGRPVRSPRSGSAWRATTDFSRAGGIRFPVSTVESGCGAIAVSIWDEAMRTPLDHIVYTVAVGDAVCEPANVGQRLRSGLITLLHDVQGNDASAALHLFEVAPEGANVQTVAIYVPDAPAGGCTHFSWVRNASLTRYLFEQRAFRGSLHRAWEKGGPPYSVLAHQIRQLLFPSRDDSPCGGWAALASLRRLSSQKGGSLFARVVDPDNRSLFVPLALLFSLEEGGQRVFAEPPALRQPLPVESLGTAERCVGTWHFLLPRNLHGYIPTIEPPTGLAESSLLRDLSDLDSLVGDWWLNEPDPADPAVGLVLLAHHIDGDLSTFDPDDRWSSPTELSGTNFPRGSVAFLCACAVGGPTKSRDLVDALAGAGFDALVLSPFNVYTPFGIELAKNFSRLVAEGLAMDTRGRIADLYAAALAETVSALESELGDRARGMSLEFLLAGRDDLRLCAASSQPSFDSEPR